MTRPFVHSETGTPASAWSPLLENDLLPEFRLPDIRRALIVSPHPDDETLGAGGLIASLAAAGTRVTVLSLTDGERVLGAIDRGLAAERRTELGDAMRCLGSQENPVDILRFGLPDGGLGRNEALALTIRDYVRGNDFCAGPWWGDGHPDHETAGISLREACVTAGIPFVAFPIWAWLWAEAGEDGLLDRAVRFEMNDAAQRAKTAALDCYRSQRRGPDPILRDTFLDHFRRPFEVFIS